VHASPVPEPFGQVVVEAMVRGVPVVATAAGGVPEILDPDGAVTDVPAPGTVHESDLGLLVAPGDVAGLAAAVVAVLDDPVAAGRRADRAHLSATTRFSVASTAGTLSDVWERVTAGVR
jgi:glycosyltransferase involved in cell wall biosynthesis